MDVPSGTLGKGFGGAVLWGLSSLAAAATVTVDLTTVTNANAPLLMGEAFDARTSFSVNGNPIGYYSPDDGSPLTIGQDWEDMHRQTSLRFPMGPVNVWNWQASVDDINAFRAPQALQGNKVAQFGLDEFMAMTARNEMPASDVTMMVNIYRDANNLINHAGAVQSAADLVAYLNKQWDGAAFTGSNWEALRAANDHPEPYGVTLFHLGNEPWAFAEYDYRTSLDPIDAQNGAKRYTSDMADFVTAMKTVDPTIKITLPATGPSLLKPAEAQAWNQTLVDELGGEIYGLSVNLYYDSENPASQGINVMKGRLDQLDASTTAFNQLGGNQLHVLIGEHAHQIDLDMNNQPIDPGDPDFAMQWQGAVATADFLAMASNLDFLERAHFFIYGNGASVWHPQRLDGYDPISGEPMYATLPAATLYEILGPLVLEEALATTTSSLASLDGESYSVSSGAFRSADHSLLTLLLVNRDGTPHSIDLLGLSSYSVFEAHVLTGSSPLAETIDISTLAMAPDGSYMLPGLSIAIVQFHIVPEPSSVSLVLVALVVLLAAPMWQRKRIGPFR